MDIKEREDMPYGGSGEEVTIPMCLEKYNNHIGATDNFTQAQTGGNGASTEDTTNHERDLSTGITATGYGTFETKESWSASADELICNFIVQNLQMNTGGSSYTFIGFKADFTIQSSANSAAFYQNTAGDWYTGSDDGVSGESNAIAAITNGDHLTIKMTSTKIEFYVNGTLTKTHTIRIPAAATYIGAMVKSATPATVARLISIDYMGVELRVDK